MTGQVLVVAPKADSVGAWLAVVVRKLWAVQDSGGRGMWTYQLLVSVCSQVLGHFEVLQKSNGLRKFGVRCGCEFACRLTRGTAACSGGGALIRNKAWAYCALGEWSRRTRAAVRQDR